MPHPTPTSELAASRAPDAESADAEPDVTWGEGGVDDWGWNTSPPDRAAAATSTEAQP
jgi:hypothetical protein